ncbi:recombinase family protein [Lapidilactobacillus luobeiensis]|uniref:recombinase family protein n=1 Tax=Lapidilactobacillus luobeiensis TaxID=2950371 RepID=UPI0021C4983A|nr:recombinase family protein [Lapidilactobacillus luobeiensis]
MKYGYARVSTESQKLASQVEQLCSAGVDKVYQEKYTGTTMERPVFESLLAVIKSGDTLVVTKLDRFARNTREALAVMQVFSDRHVTLHILNVGIIDAGPTGQLIFTLFSAFAQFERDLIVTRTQEGKAYAREHNPNFREGRRETYSEQVIKQAYQLKQSGLTYNQVATETGISVATLKRRFKRLLNGSATITSN